jgi:hypothetical protein
MGIGYTIVMTLVAITLIIASVCTMYAIFQTIELYSDGSPLKGILLLIVTCAFPLIALIAIWPFKPERSATIIALVAGLACMIVVFVAQILHIV